MITNRELTSKVEMIFAHTNQYNLPAAFANRIDSREELRKKLSSPNGPTVLLVSDILGSGKTFLVQMVMAKMGLEDTSPLIAGRTEESQFAVDRPVFIDEWDIKANPKRLKKTIDQIISGRNSDAPIIFMGDFTLKSDNFKEMVKPLGVNDYISMEQLNPDFFNLALQNRLKRAGEKTYNPEQVLIENDLLCSLVPGWNSTPANFRDVFKTLSEITYDMPQNYDPALIKIEHVRGWVAKHNPKIHEAEQQRFLSAIVKHLANLLRNREWEALLPLTLEQLLEISGNQDASKFQMEVIDPFTRSGLLSSFGFPEISEDWKNYLRYPAPYLPGTYLRLAALLEADK